MKTPASLLEACVRIAREAGERILAIYNSDFAVTHKGDDSPLTQADLAAHAHICASLKALAPEIPVLSEEDAGIPFATRSQWTRYWLVDPLDGTKEFIKRNGEFTVNIALIEGHRPVLGVVHAPVLETTYAAASGGGAFLRDGRGQRVLHTRKVPAHPVLLGSRSHSSPEEAAFMARLPPHEAIAKGSSLKFCLVAAGEADLYARFGLTSEWDTAAAQCVVEQAGGQVLRMPELTPLACNEKDSLLNPHFAVIGDPAYGWGRYLRG